MKRVAIIPARGGSKRLPRKNILPLGGKPMIVHAIEAAQKSGVFDEIIVSTEDEEIASIAKEEKVRVFTREDSLATDQATVAQVCVDVLEQLKTEDNFPDYFCCIYATAAFLLPEDLIESEKLLHQSVKADVVMGVSSYPIHPYKAMAEKDGILQVVWPQEAYKKSNSFPDFVASNGTLYWAKSETFSIETDFYPERLTGYKIPAERAIDIDTPEDYELAKKFKQ